MNKFVTAGIVVVAIAIGAGAMFGAMRFLPMNRAAHAQSTATTADPAHPKAIFFADLSGIVVSVPPQAGAPATSYVQIGMQFATYDERAVASFTTFQPIIKSAVINLLMSETSAALQDPTTRAALIQNCLDAANSVLAKDAGDRTDKPFTAAYITDFVVQD
ncbi:flagellar basal body-associated FliL family protein [Acidocella sp.]|jgi:flagellar basal body-associated protein FliL|uniref:flagellar basal body-associated FliL family protein n=1 Tax=Acidocella sp. TaxID=50710 RepID=UPI002F3EEDB7